MDIWIMDNGAHPDILGFVPGFLHNEDERDAVTQINERYPGWRDTSGCTLSSDQRELLYPGDPPLKRVAWTVFHDNEYVALFECSMMVVQDMTTKKYSVARID